MRKSGGKRSSRHLLKGGPAEIERRDRPEKMADLPINADNLAFAVPSYN